MTIPNSRGPKFVFFFMATQLTSPFHIQIKIGDFGLATRVETDGERKRTLCGTPNYIAPEVLGKKGHSFEVSNIRLLQIYIR